MSNLHRTTYIRESFSISQLRPTVDILSITFSFNDGFNRFELDIKVDSCNYIQKRQVLE